MGDKDKGKVKGKGKGNPVAEKLKKIKKIKMTVMAIGGALPVIGNIALGLLVALIVMFPIMYIGERIEEIFAAVGEFVVTTSEKMLNFTTGNGWLTNESAYYEKLNDEYKRFNNYPTAEGEFDVAIIAATTHYSKMIGTDIFTKEKCEGDPECDGEKYDPKEEPPVDKDQTKDFYFVANDNLGSAYSLWPGQKRLIGHLISTKFNTRCVTVPTGWNILNPDSWDQYAGAIGDLLESIINEVKYGVTDTFKDLLKKVNPIRLATAIWAYAAEEEAGYIETELKNVAYEISVDNFFESLDYIIANSELNFDCEYMNDIDPAPENKKWVAVPMIVKYVDYDRYEQYLKNVYLPLRFQSYLLEVDPDNDPNEWYDMKFYDGLTDKQQRLIDNMVDEIFAMRDSYIYLLGDARNSVLKVSGMNSLPVQIGSGEDWLKNYVSRGYQLGTAKCFVNGEYTGKSNCNHLAIDFSWGGCENTPITAIASGVVTVAVGDRPGPTGYGNYIIIGHSVDNDKAYEYYSLYAHLNRVDVSVGDEVTAGQQIGLLGNTGNSSGPHLHFEIRDENNLQIDPTPILNGIVEGNGTVLDGAMTCDMFSSNELTNLNNALKSKVEAAGFGTRDGVVAAARYLSNDIGIKIPYWWGGKSTSVGINSEWGCKKPIKASGSTKQPVGVQWPYGMDCSGYVSWAIRNGGYKATSIYEGSDNQYNFTDDRKDWNDPETISSVNPGDLAWRSGHIGIIISTNVPACQYTVAEEKGASTGLVVSTYECTSSQFEKIILMDDYYDNDSNKEVVE
ncbi:MAG: M23 family metallopeptidase [Bacilli bacterium]|nr:M23 family metallopeptidase [Bacilli bacterium]